jgi:16S rRNA processing protein RimM
MRLDDCFELGHIQKPHGLKGEISIFLDTDYPEEYEELGSVFVLNENGLVPFFVEYIQLTSDQKAIVKFEDIDTFELARELQAKKLYLPLSVLPALDGNQFYFHEVIGFRVYDEKSEDIGVVKSVYAAGPQDLLAVDHHGYEVLIPIIDEIVRDINREEKCISVHLPDGLLDLYTEES